MDITKLISFFAALSVATERVTEIIKGLPILSDWFAVYKSGVQEELRKVSVQLIAVASGAFVSYLVGTAVGDDRKFLLPITNCCSASFLVC